MPTIPQKIYDLIEYAFKAENWEAYNQWSIRVQSFLRSVFPDEADHFGSIRQELGGKVSTWQLARASQIGLLEGLAAKTEDVEGAMAALAGTPPTSVVPVPRQTKKVFVVH